MGAEFDAMVSRMGAAVDRTFAEDFTYRPYAAADPNARAAVDATRPVTTIKAVFSAVHARGASGPTRHPSVSLTRSAHVTNRPTAEFDLAQLAYEVRVGDRMTRAKSGALYQVSEPRSNGMGRVIVDLNEVTA